MKKYDQIHTTGFQHGLLKILPFFCHSAVDATLDFELKSLDKMV